jgi:hypothetical protein
VEAERRPREVPSPGLRCAVCHGPADHATQCAGCGTWTHPDCVSMTRRCPTIGCAAPRAVLDPDADRRMREYYGISDPWDWRPVAAIGLLMVPALCVFIGDLRYAVIVWCLTVLGVWAYQRAHRR